MCSSAPYLRLRCRRKLLPGLFAATTVCETAVAIVITDGDNTVLKACGNVLTQSRNCGHYQHDHIWCNHVADVLIEVKTILFATTANNDCYQCSHGLWPCKYECSVMHYGKKNKSRNGHVSFVPGVFKVMPSPLLCFGWMLAPLSLFRVTSLRRSEFKLTRVRPNTSQLMKVWFCENDAYACWDQRSSPNSLGFTVHVALALRQQMLHTRCWLRLSDWIGCFLHPLGKHIRNHACVNDQPSPF